MSDKRVIAEAVARRRKALSLSQMALANLSGVSRGTIRNIETGTVAPNESTWARIEPILGWAPGSLVALQQDMEPIELLPPDLLAFVWGSIHNCWDNEGLDIEGGVLLTTLKAVLERAGGDGSFGDEERIALSDIIDQFESIADESRVEEAQERLSDWLRMEKADRPQNSLREIEKVKTGDGILHEAFGLGVIVETKGVGENKKALVDFPEAGLKKLWLRYTPYRILDSPDILEGRLSVSDNRLEQILDEDIINLIRRGQVVDYSIVEPPKTSNVAVVTMVIRKGPGRLTAEDRTYIARALNALSSTDMTLRLSDGQIVLVELKGTQKPSAPTPASPPAKLPAKPSGPDPWASATKPPSNKGFAHYIDEPPF